MPHPTCLSALLAILTSLTAAGAACANEEAASRPMVTRRSSLVRLPPITPGPPITQAPNHVGNPLPEGVAGTWRQDGSFLIIDLNGQQLRLANAGPQPPADTASIQDVHNAGEVHGRLSHQGRPLAGCEVALIPLRKTWAGYTTAHPAEAKLFTAATDAAGVYHFASVPPGYYKLKWRPAGQDSWIRRAETRPDIHVRANETADIKEVHVALRTIN